MALPSAVPMQGLRMDILIQVHRDLCLGGTLGAVRTVFTVPPSWPLAMFLSEAGRKLGKVAWLHWALGTPALCPLAQGGRAPAQDPAESR